MVKVILMVTLTFCYDVDNASDVGANLYNKTLLPHPSISKMSECRGWPKTESWKYIYWFHTNTWKGHSKQSTENYLCLIFAKRICPSCNLYFCWVLIIRIWSLSPCWPIPGCPIQSSQKSSDPQLFPRHTALRCCEIAHYVQIQNMKKRKYRKSTHSNPQHLTEQNTLEGPEQKNIKCKYGEMHMVVLNIEDFCAMRKSTKWCTIHSVLCKFTWAESRSEVMWGTGQDRTSWLPQIVVPRNWIPSQPFQPLVFHDPSESHWRDCPSWVNKFWSQNSVANENNRYVGPNPKVGL